MKGVKKANQNYEKVFHLSILNSNYNDRYGKWF